MTNLRMGIDIGGTKIAAIVLEATTGKTLKTSRMPTPDNYWALLRALTDLVADYEQAVGLVTVGVCHPGSLREDTHLVQNSNILWLNKQSFELDLAQCLQREIRTGNDANCFTLSEAIDGAGQGAQVVFGATLGTGLGGGLVVDGQLHVGLNRLAGEWGHIGLPWATGEEAPGPKCYCGLSGCLETFLSGTGLARSYQQLTGQTMRAEAIVTLAEQGDEQAVLILRQFEDRLARACALVINLLDPDCIVLGGGLSALARWYINVPAKIGCYTFSAAPMKTKIVQARHGGASGMRGAAYLWGR